MTHSFPTRRSSDLLELAGLDLRQVEDVVDQAQQVRAAVVDVDGVLAVPLIAHRAEQLVLDDLGEPDDGVQRRAQLVAHVGKEVGLGATGQLGFLLREARSEEHTSELQSLMRSSYAVFCLQKK